MDFASTLPRLAATALLAVLPTLAWGQVAEGYSVGIRIFSRTLYFPDDCELITARAFLDNAIKYGCSVRDETGVAEPRFNFSIEERTPERAEAFRKMQESAATDPKFDLLDFREQQLDGLAHTYFKVVINGEFYNDAFSYEVCDAEMCLSFVGRDKPVEETVRRLFERNLYGQ